MQWADVLMFVAFAVMFGGWRIAVLCWRKAVAEHRPACDCKPCVGAALAMVERDTLQEVAKGGCPQ